MRGYLKGTLRDRVREVVGACMANGLSMSATQQAVEQMTGVGLREGAIKHLKREVRQREQESAPDAGTSQGAGGTMDSPVYAGMAGGASFNVSSYVYDGTMPAAPVPQFTGAWQLAGDHWTIINDVHIPATNWTFTDRMLSVATTLPHPRRLIIAGDLINSDAMSRYDDLVRCTPLADEFTYAGEFLDHLARWFDVIYFIRGNHDARVLFGLAGQLHAPMFQAMITSNSKVRFSMYPSLTVTSGAQNWHITHQRNYSRNPLIVARKLAGKHGMNVICAHQHHSAVGRDEWNRFSCIDSGGIHDSTKMAYVGLEDNTSPVMCNGFVTIKNGIGTLFTPEEYALTDWTQWTNMRMENVA